MSPFTLVGPLVLAAAITATFLVTAAVHTYRSRSFRLGVGDAPPELSLSDVEAPKK